MVERSKVKIKPKFSNGYTVTKTAVDLQSYLKSGNSCEVCGVGALVCAVAYRKDKIKTSTSWLSGVSDVLNPYTEIRPFFGLENSGYIEEAFERGVGVKAKTAVGRLKEICKNIIANKGKFVPLENA